MTKLSEHEVQQLDHLRASQPAAVAKLINDGLTLKEVVAKLSDGGTAGWSRAVAKLNKQHDAMRGDAN